MIKGRAIGDNITLMNTLFYRKKDAPNKKVKEHLALVYKDCDTGLKYIEEKVDPDYEYYIAKEDKRVSYPRLFIPKSDVEKITVPHKDLERDIAMRIGLTDYFYENIKNGNGGENRKLHTHPDVFNSDMNIEDHYRFRFDKLYQNNPCKISKSYFDIEADTINMVHDFPEPGECPINAITLIMQDTQQVYTFLLRNNANPQIAEFEKSVQDGSIFPELEAFVISAVGGPERAEKYNIHFKYDFLFYDEENEINLIMDLFSAINTFKPDFSLAWNMAFDVPYIIARIRKLGYRPEDIMCSKDFKDRIAEYYVDERMLSEFAERGDYALISSYTVYMDQMIQFASRRKGQGKFISFGLDAIGEAVAKVKKLDYKAITTNIAELPYKSYKTFVFYNIMDVVVQYCIEYMTGDIDYVFSKCNINNTRYSKAHRQTVYLTNRGTKEFYNMDDGYILGNNVNRFNSKPTSKFPGAFVADPSRINDYSRLRIYGRLTDIFDNSDDYDYSALYPSLMRQYNIAPHTQIGMVEILEQVFEYENRAKLENWTRASKFMEDIQSQVWLEICTRWFRLANYTELYHDIERFFRELANPTNALKERDARTGLIIPMIDYTNNGLYEAMIFNDSRVKVAELGYGPDTNRWEAWRDAALKHPNQQF